jgi:hypothetical protein
MVLTGRNTLTPDKGQYTMNINSAPTQGSTAAPTAMLRWNVETAWETMRIAREMCERLEAIGQAMEALAEASAEELGIDICDVLDPLVDVETCLG